MSATFPHDHGVPGDDSGFSAVDFSVTQLSSARTRLWRVVAMLAPLAALVIGMLLVVGAMG